MHDADFRQSERDWHSYVQQLTEKLIEIDDTVPELPVKDVVGLSVVLQSCFRVRLITICRYSAFIETCVLRQTQHRTR